MISITFKVLILLVVLLSHTKFTLRLLTKLRRSEMPKTRDLVIASFLLYYDLGLLLEVCGYEYVNHFFPSTFNAGNSSLELCIAIVALSPWFIDMTAGLWHGTSRIRCKSETTLKPRLRPAFYSTTGILSLGSVALASYFGLNQDIGKHIWVIRTVIGNTLGPYIILLFLPLYVLGFYVRLRESHSRVGVCFIVFLVLCSVTSIIPLGERTFLLMPFVIVFVFWKRTSLRGMVLIGCVSLLGAALLLPFFKWQANVKSAGIDTVSETINSDIERVPVLCDVLSRSDALGTNVLNYPGEGYVYSALFFIPRSLAPWKGYSTATYYTAQIANSEPGGTSWGFGISAIDELILNCGIIFLPIGLLLYGYAIRLADAASDKYPVLLVPTRLGAVFMLGYHLPALLQSFGGMAVLALVLHLLFCVRTRRTVTPRWLVGANPIENMSYKLSFGDHEQ